jgi:abortive infection protein
MLILILTGSYQLVGTTFTPYAFGFVLLTFPFWLIQGGTEELVTRGWLLPVMAEKSNKIIAIVVSSSLFGLLHMFNSGFTMQSLIDLILFGILETFYIIKTDNLWGAAGIHGAWNFAQGNLFGVLVSGSTTGSSLLQFAPGNGPDWLTGGSFGAEGSIVCTLVMVVTVLILAYQLKKSGKLFVKKSAEKPVEAESNNL